MPYWAMTTKDTKMLQMLIDGQAAIRADIKKVEDRLGEKMDKNGYRIDKLGASLAYLEDDTPKLEKQSASN